MTNKSFSYFSYYKWWKNLDKFILSLIITLFLVGLFFSLVSTSLIASDKLETNSYFFFFKHLTFVIIGLAIIFIFSYMDQEILYKTSVYTFCLSFLLLFLVPIFGVEVNGSKRWLDLFFLPRLQPIELVKPFFIIVLCLIITYEKLSNFSLKFTFSLMLTLLIISFLIIQPDLGQTLLIAFIWSVLIFISGINIIFLITSCSFLSIALYYSIRFVPKFEYIKNRILSFFDTETGTHNAQSEKAIDSITSGGYFGKGIGEGTLKNRVPEAHTDYIISVISEEFGVIAIILILCLFLVFIYSVFKKVYLENEERTKLILVGCISLILVQATIHIGVNIRLFPTTGMTLPFISYGGSSIISVSILSGIILNLTKRRI
ncbi:FtsW/RodA/SpoVE family cell cycle protein [Candidatus Pelagibacter sp.]|jgi:cell division protein FtsW|nr:FtsW/RodA/SpoVE family cell cycle protein [Candidatus Pelagibacter sp.]